MVNVETRAENIGMEKKWITVPEAAERIGIGRVRAYELIREGSIPSYKLSPRRTRVEIDDVDAYVKKHRRPDNL